MGDVKLELRPSWFKADPAEVDAVLRDGRGCHGNHGCLRISWIQLVDIAQYLLQVSLSGLIFDKPYLWNLRHASTGKPCLVFVGYTGTPCLDPQHLLTPLSTNKPIDESCKVLRVKGIYGFVVLAKCNDFGL